MESYTSWGKLEKVYLHNPLGIPNNGVGVEGRSGIEPELELLFFVAFALCKYICMNCIWTS